MKRQSRLSITMAAMAWANPPTAPSPKPTVEPEQVLVIGAPVPGAEPALAQAASEALIFSGLDAGEMDVAFFAASNPVSARLAKVGLRFDLPQPEPVSAPNAPGMDPDTPPRLR